LKEKEVATPKTLSRAKSLASRPAQLFPVRVLRRFADHGGPNQAVVIAWNSLTAVFPIALALAAVGGVVLDRAGITGATFAERMGGFFPQDLGTQEALIQGLDSLQHQTGLFAILAIVGFLWTGSGLFGAMEAVFADIFGTPGRPFLRQKLMAVVMMAIFAVLALLAVGTSSLVPLLNDMPGIPVSLTKGDTGSVVQAVVGFVAGFLLFFVIYTVVPNRRQRPRDVLPAALFGGVALELLAQLWPTYIRLNLGGINRFGSQFALLFILLAFFYFLGLIVVLGAHIIAVLDPPREPKPAPIPQQRKPMGRARRTALGAAALLIGFAAGRRSRA
jgi:YihY family inner membrane protein